jgi:hypothetical protein
MSIIMLSSVKSGSLPRLLPDWSFVIMAMVLLGDLMPDFE